MKTRGGFSRRHHIRWTFARRLATVTSAVIIAACVALSWVLVSRNLAELHSSLAERGRTIAEYIARESELSVLSGDVSTLQQLADAARSQRDILYCRFFDQNGDELLSSGEWRKLQAVTIYTEQAVGTPSAAADVWEFLAPVFTTDSRPRREELEFGSGSAGVPRPGETVRREVGRVAVGLSLAPLRRLNERIFATATAMTALVTCIGVLGAILLAKAMTRPLQTLARSADRIAHGDLDATVSVARSDEVGALAHSFNAMVGSLRARSERLEAINQRMQESNRLRAEFLATVSHELRTPLNVILGYCEMLADGATGEINSEQSDLVAAIQRYSQQQLDLVTNVLDFSRLTSGNVSMHIERFQLRDLLREIQSLFVGRLPPSVELAIHTPDVDMETDRVKLQAVVRNLVENAAKFTERGTIMVVARAYASTGHVRIEVRDTGCGISPDALPYIFDAFRQVDSRNNTAQRPGVGLGLSIVQQLVTVLHGDIAVASAVAVGSTFTVDVPKCWDQPDADSAAKVPLTTMSGHSRDTQRTRAA